MRRMHRMRNVVVAVGVAALAVTACGGGDDSAESETTEPEGGNVGRETVVGERGAVRGQPRGGDQRRVRRLDSPDEHLRRCRVLRDHLGDRTDGRLRREQHPDPVPGRELGVQRGLHGVDHPPPGRRDVPRRRAPGRGGGQVQLRPGGRLPPRRSGAVADDQGRRRGHRSGRRPHGEDQPRASMVGPPRRHAGRPAGDDGVAPDVRRAVVRCARAGRDRAVRVRRVGPGRQVRCREEPRLLAHGRERRRAAVPRQHRVPGHHRRRRPRRRARER